MKRYLAIIGGLLLFLLIVRTDAAHVPEMIHYQGRLVDGTDLVQGATDVVFRLFDTPVLGAALYAETQTVFVVDGLYSTALGLSNNVPGALVQVLTNDLVYLELQIGPTTLSPRERLLAVPYAFHAVQADGLSSTAVLAGDAFGLTNASATTLFGSGTISTNYLPAAALQSGGTAWPGDQGETTIHTGDVQIVSGALRFANVEAMIVSSDGVYTPYATLTNAWENVENGDSLHVSRGTHTVTRAIPLGSNDLYAAGWQDVSLIGHGAVIYGAGDGHLVTLRDSTNILVRGFEFMGDAGEPAEAGTFGELCLADDSREVIVTDCRFTDFRDHGVITIHSTNQKAAEHVWINLCRFENGGTTDYLGRGHPDGAAIADLGADWRVTQNTFVDCVRGVEIWVGDHYRDVHNVLIADNTFIDTDGNPLMVYKAPHSSIFPDQIRNVIIRNNMIQGVGKGSYGVILRQGSDILVEGNHFSVGPTANALAYLDAAVPMTNIIFRGNNFRESNNTGGWNTTLWVDYSANALPQGVIIEDNTFRDLPRRAITVPDYGCLVRNNTVIDAGGLGLSDAAIWVGSDLVLTGNVATVVENNRIINETSAGQLKYGIYKRAAANTNVVLRHNRMSGMVTADYYYADPTNCIMITVAEDESIVYPNDLEATGTITGSEFVADSATIANDLTVTGGVTVGGIAMQPVSGLRLDAWLWLTDLSQDEINVNPYAGDKDFRVETQGGQHSLFVEGSTGNVGIGTDASSEKLGVVGNVAVSGTITGLTPVYTVETNRIWTTDELRGAMIFVTATTTQTVADVSNTGHTATFQAVGAVVVTLDCSANDMLAIDGTVAAPGEAIVSSGTAGDQITIMSGSTNNWYSVGRTGTWVEETP